MARVNADERGADYERRRRMGVTECLPKSQRHITPPMFRDVLLQMARTAKVREREEVAANGCGLR